MVDHVDVPRTALDKLIDEGSMLVQGLRDLDCKPKLTGSAFIREAGKIAGAKANLDKHIHRVQKRIAKAKGSDAVRALVKKLAREFRTENYPLPNPDATRMVRIYGRADALAEIADLDLNAADVQLVAAAEAVRRWPDSFGSVVDWDRLQADVARMRDRLGNVYAEMRGTWSAWDILLSTDTPEQRERGLVRATFRRAPGVVLVADDWPDALCKYVAAHELEKPNDRRKSSKAGRPRPKLLEPAGATA